jgi:pimeloyl-ACP methyl ester carboxylesterase
MYLSEVAGLVLVAPTHEDMAQRSWELDPTMEAKNASYIEHLHECLKAKPSEFVAGSTLQQRCGLVPNSERLSPAILALQTERLLRPGYMGAWISEQENVWSASADKLRAAHRSLGDIPLIVLTSEPAPRQANETQALRDARNQIPADLHAEIARMSTHGQLRMVKDSGHYFQLDQPQEVSAAVLEVVRATSSDQPSQRER